MGHGASPPPGQRPQPLRSHPPALQRQDLRPNPLTGTAASCTAWRSPRPRRSTHASPRPERAETHVCVSAVGGRPRRLEQEGGGRSVAALTQGEARIPPPSPAPCARARAPAGACVRVAARVRACARARVRDCGRARAGECARACLRLCACVRRACVHVSSDVCPPWGAQQRAAMRAAHTAPLTEA